MNLHQSQSMFHGILKILIKNIEIDKENKKHIRNGMRKLQILFEKTKSVPQLQNQTIRNSKT